MIQYYIKIFRRTFSENLSMYIRPLIHTLPYIIFGQFVAGDYAGFIIAGGLTMFIQLDLIIVPNFRYYVLDSKNKIIDIKLSHLSVNRIIFEEAFCYTLLLLAQQLLFCLLFLNFKAMIIALLMSCLSIFMGYVMIPITDKAKNFRFSSRVGSLLCTLGAIMYPLIIFPQFVRYILMLNVFTPLSELMRNMVYPEFVSFSNLELCLFIAIDIVLYLIIYLYIRAKKFNF